MYQIAASLAPPRTRRPNVPARGPAPRSRRPYTTSAPPFQRRCASPEPWAGFANGLNQLTLSGTIVPTYDLRGNLTAAGTTAYAYNSENRLVSAGGATSLAYDPLLRLTQVASGATTTRFGYDGINLIAEYDAANAVQRRFVHGPGTDEPLVQYEGVGLTDRRWLHADERGSIIALTDAAGNAIATNSAACPERRRRRRRRDEYGIPASTNAGRFQYTGQAYLPELGMYYYKNRIYSPTLGRFLQTDPIGTAGGINLYAYVGNDPVNFIDPLGLASFPPGTICDGPNRNAVCGSRLGGGSGIGGGIGGGGGQTPAVPLPVVIREPPGGSGGAPPPPPPKPCNPSTAQLANSGTVHYRFTEGSASLGLYGAHLEGSFWTDVGYKGTFETWIWGAATPGVAIAGGLGTSKSLATFRGKNYNIQATLAFVAISDNFDPTDYSHVGDTDAVTTPGLGLGLTVSNTTLKTVMCPR